MELLFRYVKEFLPTLDAWNQLDDISQSIVREALQVFGDNPAMARRAISGEAGVWSRLLPPGHYDLWKKAFGDDGANQMVKRLTRQLQGLVEVGQLTDANIDLIFDDIVTESRVMIQEAMTDLEAGLARGATDDVISPNLGADAVPEEGLVQSGLMADVYQLKEEGFRMPAGTRVQIVSRRTLPRTGDRVSLRVVDEFGHPTSIPDI